MNQIQKFIFLLSAFLSISLFSSCGDKESDEPNALSKKYYVKYECSVSTKYVGFHYPTTVTTPKGRETFDTSSRWEATFGPFSRLEDLSLSRSCETDYVTGSSIFKGRILISIDNGPFILKAEETSNYQPLSMHYQVQESDLK